MEKTTKREEALEAAVLEYACRYGLTEAASHALFDRKFNEQVVQTYVKKFRTANTSQCARVE